MRILFINPLAESFGSTIRCRFIVRCLRELGHDVLYSEAAPSSFKDAVTVEQPDQISGYLFATRSRIDLIKKSGPFDFVYLSKLNPITAPLIVWTRLNKIPLVVDWDDLDSFFQTNWLRTVATRSVERTFPPFPHYVTTHNVLLQKYAQRRGAKKVKIIPQVVDETIFDPARFDKKRERRRLLISDDSPVAGIVLTLTAGGARDLELLFQTMLLLQENQSPLKLMIIGGGSQKYHYQEMARAQGLDTIIWTDWIPYESVPRHLAACDIALIMMRDDPGNRYRFSLKLLEYLAMNMPVFGSLCGASADKLNGYLEESVGADPEALADTLSDWVTENWLDTQYDFQQGTSLIRERIVENYGLQTMKNSLQELILSIEQGGILNDTLHH
ncbi:glycosyltransferase [candidate division CSSED10-310 bacterium]|uniref:Glycosyltransferase n=1 Tax=candidate division CSSED10-310 bacterium TaxID=2855610 RepID=A0ABV6YZI7_UNCC1